MKVCEGYTWKGPSIGYLYSQTFSHLSGNRAFVVGLKRNAYIFRLLVNKRLVTVRLGYILLRSVIIS